MQPKINPHGVLTIGIICVLLVFVTGVAWQAYGASDSEVSPDQAREDQDEGTQASGGCHPTCYCLGLNCPSVAGDCSGCDSGSGDDKSDEDCEDGDICVGGNPGGGGGNPGNPPGSCYTVALQAMCVDSDENPHNDGCVCGMAATPVQEAHYMMCYEGLQLLPLPPNGSCEIICGPDVVPDELQAACMALCEELCEDNPGCVDLSDALIEWICCDLATGTSVPWADCYNTTLHPFPDNPSSQCCTENNENSWDHGCEACCAVEATFGSANHQRCIQGCDEVHLAHCGI